MQCNPGKKNRPVFLLQGWLCLLNNGRLDGVLGRQVVRRLPGRPNRQRLGVLGLGPREPSRAEGDGHGAVVVAALVVAVDKVSAQQQLCRLQILADLAGIGMYRVRQQKPDAQNFTSKKTLKKRV